MPGSHITEPKGNTFGNNVHAKRPVSAVQIYGSGSDDINNDIGTYAGQKSRNYETPYGTSGNL